ncbi:MAG: hypothetical protein ABIQ93_10790 [Saprospiraceae bacterium]
MKVKTALLEFLSRYYLLILFLAFYPVMYDRVNGKPRGVIWSDCEGYYKYLPGLFIIGDFHKIPAGSVWPVKNDQGEILLKYTYGVSIFEAPFFLAARQYCIWKNQEPDDFFNRHYCRAIAIGGYCVGFLGLFFLRRGLLRYFSPAVTFWTLMCVFFGTNLFHYTVKEMGMSHVYSFCLMAFLVWHVPRFYADPRWQKAALLGGAAGWLILIRPTNFAVLFFIALYDVYSWPDLKDRLAFWLQHRLQIGVAAGMAFLFFLPQMLYWHALLGKWVHYSYTDEKFIYWNQPKIAAVLFDVQNGLFIYSPLVLLMVIGIFMGLPQRKHQAPALLIIFIISTYLFASWWAWWFGGAFGHRSYVELYALLALPLGGLLERSWESRYSAIRWSMVALTVLLMVYSVRLSFLYNILDGPWDGPDWRWNWEKLSWIWSHFFDFLKGGR